MLPPAHTLPGVSQTRTGEQGVDVKAVNLKKSKLIIVEDREELE